ncbi:MULTISPECIES: outer membrane protein assembly factor BamB family protein [Sphingobacterium]|uniref:PQQ-binding-like beta-propeller repeat protein n=1 Tax=Sphingobacterium populi TaxID=1812824 RepID=A0ABW5U9K0_9SPHI|nr:PQQ-binding-like beta-propeller repeat protein [Sphingobacterium sp. CFCC 11742]
MKGTIIVSIILFVAVVAASVFYFTGLGSAQKDMTKPLTFLPEETLLIAAFKNEETTDNIFKDYEVFDALLGFEQKQNMNDLKQQLLRSPTLTPYLAGTDVYVSFHDVDKSVEMLFTIPTIEPIKESSVNNFLAQLSDRYQFTALDTLGQRIFALQRDSSEVTWYAAYHADIFFVSPALSVLEKVLDKRHPKLSRQQIAFFLENTNRNVPLSFYFAHEQIDSLSKKFLRNRPGHFIQQFLGLDGQSTWNINYKQDALMLTGESELDKKEQNYLSLFAFQQKTTQRLYHYFPANTALYLEYSVSDLRKYRQDLEKYLTRKPNQKRILDQLENTRSSRPNITSGFEAAGGSGFAVAELNNGDNLGFLSLRDSTALDGMLSDLAEDVGNGLYRLKYENLLYAYYGDAFQIFPRPYFTIIDDVVVFANQSATVSNYLSQWQNSDLLVGTLGFKNYERMQGDEANVTFFLHTKNASRMLSNNLIRPLAQNLRDSKAYGYQDFYAWSAQLMGNGGNFISSIYGIYKSSTALGSSPDWTYAFNNRLITRPYVFEHSDTSQFILVQEQDHTLHAIHPSGTKIWSTVFSGRVIGDMIQLADRSILLVTDRNRLYRFDPKGNGLPGFSISLPEEPTGSPVVLTIDRRDIIFVPLRDRLLAYDMEGNAVSNWASTAVSGRLLSGIYLANNEIVVGSTSGKVYYFNSEGQIVHEIAAPTEAEATFRNPLGHIISASSGAEDVFITTDSAGKLYRYAKSNGVSSTSNAELSGNHRAFFAPLSVASIPDMVVLDDNKLSVYQTADSTSLRYSQGFTKEIYSSPLFFPISRTIVQLGVSVPSNNLIYVFTENGNVIDGFPVEALPLFYYGPINYNSGNYLLSTKRDHKLYAYKH